MVRIESDLDTSAKWLDHTNAYVLQKKINEIITENYLSLLRGAITDSVVMPV